MGIMPHSPSMRGITTKFAFLVKAVFSGVTTMHFMDIAGKLLKKGNVT